VSTLSSAAPIVERLNAIRDRLHTKRHPFFREFSEGRLPLKALGRYQALHYHFVSYALPSFGMFYARAYKFSDIRKAMAQNLAEKEGRKAIPQQGHPPHDHNEVMFRFCRAAGLTNAEV
jgi:pyrroloquinoline quinone (PQQ) biosynthesis protein C